MTKLAEFFPRSHIFSAELVARGKPAPDLFLYVADQLGFSPEQCLVIEDSIPGIFAAQAANMPVIGFVGASHARYPWYQERLKQTGVEIFPSYSDFIHHYYVLSTM